MGPRTMKKLIYTPALVLALAACGSSPKNDTQMVAPVYPTYMAPPANDEAKVQTASLWETSPTSLLALRRAKDIGDLLTVVVQMNDQANLQSSLSRTRGSENRLDIRALLGLPDAANSVLPNGASLAPTFDFGRDSSLTGNGAVNRAEQVTFRLAARVVGVEPNGNLIIQGYQQALVSNEIRYLSVSGVIRTQDITRDNTVSYDKIADAQFSYVSEGEATGAVGRKPGTKLVDRIIPF